MTSFLKIVAADIAAVAASTISYVGTDSQRFGTDDDNQTITLPGTAAADDWVIVSLVGQAMTITSVGGAGTQVLAPTDHGTETGTSGRDYELSVWKYQLVAGDITTGTIATVTTNVRCLQAVVVTGTVSTITASAVTAVDGANDLATAAMTPTGATSVLISFMSVFNGTGDCVTPSNMNGAGTNFIAEATTSDYNRTSAAAYVELTSTAQFTPAIWDGTAAVDYMGVSILAQEAV